MFGYNVKLIAEGWIKDALGKEELLSLKRLQICRLCPLYTAQSLFGEICDSKKFLDMKTGEVQSFPTDTNRQGCGCALSKKTRVLSAHCVLDKW